MNDFLKSMREREKQMDKNRRPHSNPQYRNPDRQGSENRKPPYNRFVTVEQFQAVIGESLPVLKSLLETLSESQQRQADAGERIARAEELKAESLKGLAEYLKRGVQEAPVMDSAGESAGIAEESVEAAVEAEAEKETAPAPVEAEPVAPAPAGERSKSSGKPAEGKAAKQGAGITEKVLNEIGKNPGVDFKTLVKNTGLETKQVQNALPPLKKAGKIRSEGKGVYFPSWSAGA
jgi:predicted Rossmann fold nucleotide-binding protein DprA/Smf involved in DNA uptake